MNCRYLWTFASDEIIMADYMLDYIDIQEVREVVQASLNRGESYHQLSSIIAKVRAAAGC